MWRVMELEIPIQKSASSLIYFIILWFSEWTFFPHPTINRTDCEWDEKRLCGVGSYASQHNTTQSLSYRYVQPREVSTRDTKTLLSPPYASLFFCLCNRIDQDQRSKENAHAHAHTLVVRGSWYAHRSCHLASPRKHVMPPVKSSSAADYEDLVSRQRELEDEIRKVMVGDVDTMNDADKLVPPLTAPAPPKHKKGQAVSIVDLPPVPDKTDTHWDYLLKEMQWCVWYTSMRQEIK